MFERFTERAKQTIFFAKYEAGRRGLQEIGTEHILLGLFEDTDLTSNILDGFSLNDIVNRILPRSSGQSEPAVSFDLGLSNESRQALDLADEEAVRLCSRYIGNEHILLGLLRVEDCFAAQLLRDVRFSVDHVRAQISALGPQLETNISLSPSPPVHEPKEPGLALQVRDLVRRGEPLDALRLVDDLLAGTRHDRNFRVKMLCPIAMAISKRIGDLNLVKRYCEELLSVAPGDLRTLYHLADCLDLQGQTDEAKEYAARCYKLSLERDDAQARERLERRFPEIKR